jgi:hypothetical protein
MLFLIILAIGMSALATCVLAYRALRSRMRRTLALLASCMVFGGTFLAVGLPVLEVVFSCSNSAEIRRLISKDLTEAEVQTIEGTGGLCPTDFRLIRNGQPEIATGACGMRGCKIWFGAG